MHPIWRGSLATRIRIISGLVLMAYAATHFLIIGLALISPDLSQNAQDARKLVTRSLLGTLLLYGAFIAHIALALGRLAFRRTLRMPFWELVQIALGLSIPLMLMAHLTFTRAAHEWFGVNDEIAFIVGLIWGTNDGWVQSILLLIVWLHGCLGLHFWLKGQPWWQANLPALTASAVLVPAFALAGFATEGRRLQPLLADPEQAAILAERQNFPDGPTFGALFRIQDTGLNIIYVLFGIAALVYAARKVIRSRTSLRVRYVDGPEIVSPKGATLLEISRAHGVPHTALCGGKGRCTTCRVIVEEGADHLPPPGEVEARSLLAVKASSGARLACQVRPTGDLTVFRVFRPDGRRARAHASHGQEKRLAILFLDIRGFTARTNGQLPYDVVFLLNRFFDAIVPSITAAGGTVDKYMGDGLLAVFETGDETGSAQSALRAVSGIGTALATFNRALEEEGAPEIRIGIGLHLGDLVLGEIGAAGNAPRTIIGEAVNAASRLEAETKALGVEMLVSDAVIAAAGFDAEALSFQTLSLRGVEHPIRALPIRRAAELDVRIAAAIRSSHPA